MSAPEERLADDGKRSYALDITLGAKAKIERGSGREGTVRLPIIRGWRMTGSAGTALQR